jgi:Protein of unknown function (DUF3800)
MQLKPGGIDIYYIDESHDTKIYLVTAIRVPFMRNIEGIWTITWQSHLEAAKQWRKVIREADGVPAQKELHGVKLASGRGNYNRGKHNFNMSKAGAVYRRCLAAMNFVPSESVMSAVATRDANLYGHARLEAALLALFQRIRRQCSSADRNALMFFDQGHPEYRKLYRASCVHLPTGRRDGPMVNLPLDMFVKDGNEKNSKHCHFTQAADLIAYSAFLKIKGERGSLTPDQELYSQNNIYDALPQNLPNRRVSGRAPQDGIVRL